MDRWETTYLEVSIWIIEVVADRGFEMVIGTLGDGCQ
jgi:hypothetical protein